MSENTAIEWCDATINMWHGCEEELDYFAVYTKRGPKARANFLLHVCTKGGRKRALRVARNEGHKLPRWSFAVRVGKEGYYESLRREFQS